MLDKISGTVTQLYDQTIAVNSGNGLDLEIAVPNPHLFEQNKSVILWIYLHWNAEHGPSLYGFEQLVDRALFKLIISCNGIGPKIGLAILSQLTSTIFVQAIRNSDHATIAQVNGIGPKKAEQIVVALKHKIDKMNLSFAVELSTINSHWFEVSQALQSLNYSQSEINFAFTQIKHQNSDRELKFDILLKRALVVLSK
jgi:Holliday junction DNA helicase RuvA